MPILLIYLIVLGHASRILPQKAWAASVPTLLSNEAFDTLLTPNLLPGALCSVSPLERFLGCAFLRKHLPRIIQAEDEVRGLQARASNLISREGGHRLFQILSMIHFRKTK